MAEEVMIPREEEVLLQVLDQTDLGFPDPLDEVEEVEAAGAVRLTTITMTMTMEVTVIPRKDMF